MIEERYFKVPTLEKWQHYKDRCPPWIKLHRDIFNDYKFSQLLDHEKAHLMLIWLLASQMENRLPYDHKWISQKIGISTKLDLDKLQVHGFIVLIQDDSKMIASCKQSADVETETETYTTDRDIKYSCPEAEKNSAPDLIHEDLVKMVFPIIGKEKTFNVYQSDIDQWQNTFLGVDVLLEVKKCLQWNIDNPTKRKTAKGIRTHVSSWLGRAQDGSSNKSRRSFSKKNEASDFRNQCAEELLSGGRNGAITAE